MGDEGVWWLRFKRKGLVEAEESQTSEKNFFRFCLRESG